MTWIAARLLPPVLRLRADPDDRLRQRRQPAARARRLAPAGDRHPAVAWRITPAHHPAAAHGEPPPCARGGGMRSCRLAAVSGGCALCGDHHTTAGDRPVRESVQPCRPRRGLADAGVPGGWRHRVDGVLRARTGAAGDPPRPGADHARRSDEGCASAPRTACPDRRPGRRIGSPPDLCRHLSARCLRRRDEGSGRTDERHVEGLHREPNHGAPRCSRP